MIRSITLAAAMLASASAWAAPPEFCQRYAREAVHEFRADTHIPLCFHGENARWNDNYEGHFNWCLGVSIERANSEREYRRGKLDECRARLHY